MKFSEYIKNIQEFAEKHPESLDMEVIYSSDDEGNSYNAVYYTPTLMMVEDREPICSEEDEDFIPNAVCIN